MSVTFLSQDAATWDAKGVLMSVSYIMLRRSPVVAKFPVPIEEGNILCFADQLDATPFLGDKWIKRIFLKGQRP